MRWPLNRVPLEEQSRTGLQGKPASTLKANGPAVLGCFEGRAKAARQRPLTRDPLQGHSAGGVHSSIRKKINPSTGNTPLTINVRYEEPGVRGESIYSGS